MGSKPERSVKTKMRYKKLDMPKVEEAVKNLLIALGEDVDRDGLKETPRRVAKYWAEKL